MIRTCDFIFSLVSLVIVFPLCAFVIIIGWLDTGSPLFFQKRIGINLKSFNLFKFRTMKIGTLSLGTHLIDPSNITYFGGFLRKFKIDELPQLWNVLIGDMSLVGPRPCLFNQRKLISERKKLGIFKVRPGITGWAQVKWKYDTNLEDVKEKTKYDLFYVENMSLRMDFKILFNTLVTIFTGKGQ